MTEKIERCNIEFEDDDGMGRFICDLPKGHTGLHESASWHRVDERPLANSDYIPCYKCGKPTYTECLDIVNDQLLCPVCKDRVTDERLELEKIIDFLINDCEVTAISTPGHLMVPKPVTK